MTTRQRFVIWGWIGAIVASGIYPPWAQHDNPAGYHLIIAPPNRSLHVDHSRLTIEWFIVTVVAIGLYFAWPTEGSRK